MRTSEDPSITDLLLFEKKFWQRVRKGSKCWCWTGKLNKNGYGIFFMGEGRGAIRAHRYSWLIVKGVTNRLHVLHECDNPKCVRPDHLFLGTQADNVADMTAKGRNSRKGAIVPATGEQHGMARLSLEDVLEIRRLYVPRKGVGSLAKRFGISRGHVRRVASGGNWQRSVVDLSQALEEL